MLRAQRRTCTPRGGVALPQELTNFHFEVAPEALRGALERFSQVRAAFLRAPT